MPRFGAVECIVVLEGSAPLFMGFVPGMVEVDVHPGLPVMEDRDSSIPPSKE
jgi:hypothetical protein